MSKNLPCLSLNTIYMNCIVFIQIGFDDLKTFQICILVLSLL